MFSDYLRMALASPPLAAGQANVNANRIARLWQDEDKAGANLVVFPPLALTGVTCQDLILNRGLLQEVNQALSALAEASQDLYSYACVAFPMLYQQQLYQGVALIHAGQIEAIIPLPSPREDRLFRNFAGQTVTQPGSYNPAPGRDVAVLPSNSLISFADFPQLALRLLTTDRHGRLLFDPSDQADAAGQVLLVFAPTAAVWGGTQQIREQVTAISRQTGAALAWITPGQGESSGDGVYGGYRLITEAGEKLAESPLFTHTAVVADLDLDYLQAAACRQPGYARPAPGKLYRLPKAENPRQTGDLKRPLNPLPFLPEEATAPQALEEALELLARGLERRMQQLPGSRPILGLSGGLDSSLALFICLRALDHLERPHHDLLAVFMPGPGSHERTSNNARALAQAVGADFEEISLEKSLAQHLQDIGHPADVFDTAYENAQARERTQILMDLANSRQGFVVGTGDLSELALGWCTYNGDSMAMYNVNASVPKTLVRALCQHEAERFQRKQPTISELIFDILATPVSPELLPTRQRAFSQKTEDILGPYELHDFFIWHLLKRHSSPQKILTLANLTFRTIYDPPLIKKSWQTFMKRFPQNQFKRSAAPDGASLNIVSLSPREGFAMPSDLAGSETTTSWLATQA